MRPPKSTAAKDELSANGWRFLPPDLVTSVSDISPSSDS